MTSNMSAMLVGALLLALLAAVPTPADARVLPKLGTGSSRHLTQTASNATGATAPNPTAQPAKYPSAWHAMGRPVPPQNASSAQAPEVQFNTPQPASQAPPQKTYTVAGLPIAALSAIASIAGVLLIVGVGSTVACCYYCSHRRRHAEERDVMPEEMVKGSWTSGGTVSRTASQLEALKEEHQQV